MIVSPTLHLIGSIEIVEIIVTIHSMNVSLGYYISIIMVKMFTAPASWFKVRFPADYIL